MRPTGLESQIALLFFFHIRENKNSVLAIFGIGAGNLNETFPRFRQESIGFSKSLMVEEKQAEVFFGPFAIFKRNPLQKLNKRKRIPLKRRKDALRQKRRVRRKRDSNALLKSETGARKREAQRQRSFRNGFFR